MNAAGLRIAEQSLRNACMNEWHSRSCLGMPFFWQLGRRQKKRDWSFSEEEWLNQKQKRNKK